MQPPVDQVPYIVVLMHENKTVSLWPCATLRDVEIFCEDLPQTDSPVVGVRRYVLLP